ncbi:MAG: flagellar assembly protein FliW [Clostridiales bacterium]|nr:flagellar assembly protein FliW [Clostridiales bacterium]
MLVKTKYFGEIDLSEDKIITMENGLMGFEEYKRYTILYDNEKEEQPNISWLQSVEEPALALPVINPFLVKSDYNPVVEDEVLKPLGELNEENLAIFLVLTVPSKPEEVTANLKAPLIINADTRKGCQIIVENKDYVIKYKVYDAIQKIKKEKGEMGC